MTEGVIEVRVDGHNRGRARVDVHGVVGIQGQGNRRHIHLVLHSPATVYGHHGLDFGVTPLYGIKTTGATDFQRHQAVGVGRRVQVFRVG